jgi:ketosteroid isomerase-like protein
MREGGRMHANQDLISQFYTAFNERDAETMARSYAEDATFEDPAFGQLTAPEARAMWRMLLGRATDLRAEFRDVRADDDTGSAHWEAYYTFNSKPVHNVIDADFEFRDGLITKHVDSFDWPRWAGQALGMPGKVLGRTAFLRRRAGAKARAQLDAYIAQHGTR